MRLTFTKRVVAMLSAILIILFVTLHLNARQQLSKLAYVTRPLWDSPQKPFDIIVHYDSPTLSKEQLCQLHGWSEASAEVRVIDAFLFSIRLNELNDVVDKFIILESTATFTGRSKPLVYQENAHLFEKFQDKIIYGTVEPPDFQSGDDPFEFEKMHRIKMNELISQAGPKKGDWILMMDVDEIPSSKTIRLLKSCDGIPDKMHLQLRNYIYSFEFFYDWDSWRGAAVRYSTSPLSFYGHARKSDFMLADAGWHCSFCFRKLSDFQFKMQGYSHADRVFHQGLLDPSRIQNTICEGKDIFDMIPEVWNYKDLVKKWGSLQKETTALGLPDYLITHAEKFRFLLPGGCKREP